MAKESAPGPRKPAAHPPYLHMITEALTTLKERTGSSVPAMAKFLEQKYGDSLPENFRKMLTVQLKKLVKSERLVKVKNSFKLSAGKPTKDDSKSKDKKAASSKKDKEKKNQNQNQKKSVSESNNNTKDKDQKKSQNPKASEAKKVVKKAMKTKRLSLGKTQAGMKKADQKVAAKDKSKKVAEPAKSTKKKSAAATKK